MAKTILLSLPLIHTHTRTYPSIVKRTHKLPQSHRGEGHQEALCAIEGLEDSGYLEHDRASLWVVHPLGAVEGILQHVFKRCTHTHTHNAKNIFNKKPEVCKTSSNITNFACLVCQDNLDHRLLRYQP